MCCQRHMFCVVTVIVLHQCFIVCQAFTFLLILFLDVGEISASLQFKSVSSLAHFLIGFEKTLTDFNGSEDRNMTQ